jgi:hypothetical protein
MALVDVVGSLALFQFENQGGAPTITGGVGNLIDAAGEKTGIVFQVPRTGNIRYVSFVVATVGSAPTGVHDVRLETVDAATGLATGTLVGTNTNNTQLLNTTGWKTVQLTADASVTEGQMVALMVVAPGANFGAIRTGSFTNFEGAQVPYSLLAPAGGTRSQIGAPMAVEYDDATIPVLQTSWPASSITAQTYQSGTNPNRRGIIFSVPFACRLSGCVASLNATGDFNVVFYATDGVTATTVATSDKDVRAGVVGKNTIDFTTKPTLVANTPYRLVFVPTTATTMTLYTMTLSASKYLAGFPGGTAIYQTTVNGAPAAEGDWTQTDTSRPLIGLMFDQVDDGTGAPGGSEVAYTFVG